MKVRDWLIKQLCRNRRFARWFDRRVVNQKLKELHAFFSPKLEEATLKKDWNERDNINAEWDFEKQLVLDPIESDESDALISKARKYGIAVPRQTDDSDDWYRSSATGLWILSYDASAKLAKEIRDELRASTDEFRKWTTLGFALLGFVWDYSQFSSATSRTHAL